MMAEVIGMAREMAGAEGTARTRAGVKGTSRMAGVFAGLMVIVLALGAAAASGPGNGPGPGDPGQDPARNAVMAKAQECDMFGQMTLNDTSFSGRYVSLELDDGVVSNYTVEDAGAVLFGSVVLEPFCCTGWSASGAVARINGSAATVVAHNNPASVLHIVKEQGSNLTVRLTLGAGLVAEKCNGSDNIRISGALEAIVLVGAAGSEVNGSEVLVEYGPAAGSLTVRVEPEGAQGLRLQAHEMAREGWLGGELDVVGANATYMENSCGYAHSTSMTVKAAGSGKVKVTVRAEHAEGMIFRIGVDRETMGVREAKQLRASLDGETMKRVSAEELVRYKLEMRERAAYCVEVGVRSCEVLAYIPHFSEHELTLEKAAEPPTPGVPGFEVVLVIVSLCGVALVTASRRR